MAILVHIYPSTQAVAREVEVHNATSMRYAALHVAEAAGYHPTDHDFVLITAEGDFIDPDDLAANWHMRGVALAWVAGLFIDTEETEK